MNNTSSRGLAFKDLYFPFGLEGYPEWQHFSVEQKKETKPIFLFRSVEEPKVSLIVADPHTWFPNYQLNLTKEDLADIKANSSRDVAPFAIITVETDPFSITANLLGPLVINPAKGLGKQVIQTQSPYQAKQPLTLQTISLTFTNGLEGLPDWEKYTLNIVDELRPVKILACQDMPKITFPVVDPWIINPDYKPRLDKEDLKQLEARDMLGLKWLVILNVRNEPFDVTANMLGPIAYNPKNGKAKQVILTQSGYDANHVLQNVEFTIEG